MPHGPHFYEPRTDVTFLGTIQIAPDRFLENPEEYIENPEHLSIELESTREGFTYQVTASDVRAAELRPDGTFEISYVPPERDDHRTETAVLPRGFSITELTT